MEPNNPTTSRQTSAEKQTPRYLQEFLKSYLFLLHSGRLSDREVEVVSLSGISDQSERRCKPLSLSDDLDGKFVRVLDSLVGATVRYCGSLYHVSLFLHNRHGDDPEPYVYVLGGSVEASDSQKLLDCLLTQSVRNSPYQNSMLLATSERLFGNEIGLYPIDVGSDSLDEVFLPTETRRQLDLFISALVNFNEMGIPLRYLFSGKPGTGKTKTIRAIANTCKGKATFLFSSGAEQRVDELFEIASVFSPVVLCIDDIDMLTGSRQDRLYSKQLAAFLQRLDGFSRGDQFLLATTNDKALVDLAASRPGRFDRVLDVSLIEPIHYKNLVNSKTRNEKIVDQFDEEVLGILRRNRVSGAFIATLVKHLELVAAFDPIRLDHEYLLSTIKDSLDGFYEESREGCPEVGFRTN